MRTGESYLESLRDGRTVLLDGEAVEDVTEHWAFAAQARRIAAMMDRTAQDTTGELTAVDEATGERYANMWLIPRTAEDLAHRRRGHLAWARSSFGLMGRSPDHVASALTAMAGAADLFDRSRPGFGANVRAFYEKARRESLYCSYVIVPPQIDRSQPAHRQPEPFLYAGVSAERDDGVVITGAQMVGTAAVFSDHILVTQIRPLEPGDEDYAFSAVVPVSAPGVTLHPRVPYGHAEDKSFDYPLSSSLDETDSVVIFKDVFVPWEQVFILRDREAVMRQWSATGANVLSNWQALNRFSVKMSFASGLARKLAELHRIDRVRPVQAQLGGSIAVDTIAIQAVVEAAMRHPEPIAGMAVPGRQYVNGGLNMQRRIACDAIRTLREIAGGAFMALPSSHQSITHPDTADDVAKYYQAVGTDTVDRIGFLKLMWDFVGTEFAGRQQQYELFYAGQPHINDVRVFDTFGWHEGVELVDRALVELRRGAD
ncbi:MAG TPA: 4-hydroxyphenylacetate 3-hydroxylase N-terminal domain-containing protein [Glycomyces sp.]|nr:4-hydroxyphenylacetate 3-hydroxylase N-terminal domain-containing protein [Glycomyces sp.]